MKLETEPFPDIQYDPLKIPYSVLCLVSMTLHVSLSFKNYSSVNGTFAVDKKWS